MKRYVLLDRDGTLVRDTGHPHRPEDYDLLPGVGAALRRLLDAGFRLAIVTNQSGIGRGWFDVAAFDRFHARLLADLTKANVSIDATFVCPHAPEAGCACRKPAPGLVLRAQTELGADLATSWVVGDTDRDVGAARNAGCFGAVRLGAASMRCAADPLALEAPDLTAAVELILGYGTP